MKNMILIGITGQSGAGKSALSRHFTESGIPVLSMDDMARKVVEPYTPCLAELAAYFGDGILGDGIHLDRAALRDIAFSDKTKLAKLNEITHKYIRGETEVWLAELGNQGKTLAAIDASQLFESGFDAMCDRVVCVIAPHQTCINRIIARDNITEQVAEQRLANQLPREFFTDKADYLIDNSSDPNHLEYAASQVITQIKNLLYNES